MDFTTIFILVAALLLGAVISYLFANLKFAKNYVTGSTYAIAEQELLKLRSDKTYLETQCADFRDEKNKLLAEVKSKTDEITRLSTSLATCTNECGNMTGVIEELKNQLQFEKTKCETLLGDLTIAQKRLVHADVELKQNGEKLQTQKEEMEKLGQKFEDAFKVLAQQILEDKTKKFSEEQEKNLKSILQPLQIQINQFKTDIETKQKQESDERISLREQVKIITQTNQTLSEQANKLTETLRLQVKQQGDWGESILEAILENSGLQKDLQYFTQQSSRNNDGKTIRPDVLVKYPDQRTIIIDSKVSLVHYYNMCNAVKEEEQNNFAKQLVQSLKNHIDDLAGKNYTDLTQALDLIVMFVPVEPAYIAAMHTEPELWQYAYKKGILLVSPANLIATLKLVKDMWRKDAVDRNAQEIADKAGKLYDKLVSFVESFEKIGNQLERAGESWTEAKKQLASGRGNLVSQAHKMKSLHIDAKKSLPEQLVNGALVTDELELECNSTEMSLFD